MEYNTTSFHHDTLTLYVRKASYDANMKYVTTTSPYIKGKTAENAFMDVANSNIEGAVENSERQGSRKTLENRR